MFLLVPKPDDRPRAVTSLPQSLVLVKCLNCPFHVSAYTHYPTLRTQYEEITSTLRTQAGYLLIGLVCKVFLCVLICVYMSYRSRL